MLESPLPVSLMILLKRRRNEMSTWAAAPTSQPRVHKRMPSTRLEAWTRTRARREAKHRTSPADDVAAESPKRTMAVMTDRAVSSAIFVEDERAPDDETQRYETCPLTAPRAVQHDGALAQRPLVFSEPDAVQGEPRLVARLLRRFEDRGTAVQWLVVKLVAERSKAHDADMREPSSADVVEEFWRACYRVNCVDRHLRSLRGVKLGDLLENLERDDTYVDAANDVVTRAIAETIPPAVFELERLPFRGARLWPTRDAAADVLRQFATSPFGVRRRTRKAGSILSRGGLHDPTPKTKTKKRVRWWDEQDKIHTPTRPMFPKDRTANCIL